MLPLFFIIILLGRVRFCSTRSNIFKFRSLFLPLYFQFRTGLSRSLLLLLLLLDRMCGESELTSTIQFVWHENFITFSTCMLVYVRVFRSAAAYLHLLRFARFHSPHSVSLSLVALKACTQVNEKGKGQRACPRMFNLYVTKMLKRCFGADSSPYFFFEFHHRVRIVMVTGFMFTKNVRGTKRIPEALIAKHCA